MFDRVDHILIGAGRSGTTSLFDYLDQHPQVCSSIIKEVIYFSIDDHYQQGDNHLKTFFPEKQADQIFSTSDTYLHINSIAAQRIYDHNPNCKISMILREPGARAFSSYQYAQNNGHDSSSLSFIETLEREKEILKGKDIVKINNLCHFHGSLYYYHLTNWEKLFGKDQLFICTTNELKKDPVDLLQRLFQFLEVSPFEVKELTAKNKAASAKNKALHQFLINRDHPLRKVVRKPLQIPFIKKAVLKSGVADKVKKMNMKDASYVGMTEEERAFCDDYFKEDLQKLKSSYGVDFSSEK